MNKSILYVIISLIIFIIMYVVVGNKDKVAYIKMGVVVEQYKMKQDLENLFSKELEKRKLNLEHLVFVIDSISRVDTSKLKRYRDHYNEQIAKFGAYQEEKSAEIRMQVINRVNEAASTFGKEKNYDFLFGANGQGSIMFAADSKDVTNEFIDYINNEFRSQ